MKRSLSQKDKNTILDCVSSFFEKQSYIVFAYVFGSFCSDNLFGDIDIAIFVDNNDQKNALTTELELERQLIDITGFSVDIRILNSAPLTFAFNVIKEGIVLFDRDPDVRADFEGLTFKKYFDFRHLRNEYLREIAHAPI